MTIDRKRRNYRRLFFLMVIVALGFLHFYIPRVITEMRSPLTAIARGASTSKPAQAYESLENIKPIYFETFDGELLSAYIATSTAGSAKGTIILLHGIRSRKEHFIELSQMLAAHGYNTVALDSRGHGQSGGVHCTFGVKERKDISALVDYLLEEEQISEHIGVWGQSLGGAIALQAMGTDARIQFGIVESTFSDFRSIVSDYISYNTGLNIKLLDNYLVDRAGSIADFDPDDARPLKYCGNIGQPILVVHGDVDRRIDIEYAKANFSLIASQDKEFIAVEYANHLNVWQVGGDAYFKRLMVFLETSTSSDDQSDNLSP